MGYDIPDKVRYREKIIFGLDMKQLAYALVFGFGAIIAYGLPINGDLKFALPFAIGLVGFGFIFFRFEERIIERWSYLQVLLLRKDKAKFAKNVIRIEKIERGCIVLPKGELRAVLQVTPVNFALFDDDRKKALIGNYRDFLNHLNYPIQIVVRTKRASLGEYYAAYEERAKGLLEGKLGELYNDYKEHEIEFLKANSVNEREYYLIVCLRPDSKDKEEAFSRLEERVLIMQDKLLECVIESKRLENKELEPFAISYFKADDKNEEKTKEEQEKAKAQAEGGTTQT